MPRISATPPSNSSAMTPYARMAGSPIEAKKPTKPGIVKTKILSPTCARNMVPRLRRNMRAAYGAVDCLITCGLLRCSDVFLSRQHQHETVAFVHIESPVPKRFGCPQDDQLLPQG